MWNYNNKIPLHPCGRCPLGDFYLFLTFRPNGLIWRLVFNKPFIKGIKDGEIQVIPRLVIIESPWDPRWTRWGLDGVFLLLIHTSMNRQLAQIGLRPTPCQPLWEGLVAPLGLAGLFAKIVTEATPGPKANIRCLTFHYREIFTRLLAQVGFGRAPTKIAQKRTPASWATIRLLTFHYRQILKPSLAE